MLEQVRERLPQIRASSERCERERSVPASNIELVRATGLFRLFQPRRYGGLEGSPLEFFDAVAAIGGACTSTGWVAGVLGSHQFVVSQFSERAQDDVWATTPDSVVVATFDPSRATAVPVDGGYRVSGVWSFASGCHHATWHSVGATIEDEAANPHERAFLLLLSSDMTYVDTWNVSGLRGTGSNDATLTDYFVPEHRMLKISDIIAMETPGQNVNRSMLYRLPVFTIIPLGIVAPIVGATTQAVQTFTATLRDRVKGGGVRGESSKAAESPLIQRQIAEASGLMAAGSALIRSGLEATWAEVSERKLSGNRRIENRRDYALAVRFCVQTINALFESSGSGVIYLPNSIERIWRDINTAAKHQGLNWDVMGTMSGRFLAGLEPRGQF